MTSHADLAKVLNPGNLISGCTVIFSEFRFDDDLWIELVGDNKIRCLIKTRHPFSSLCFSITDPRLVQDILNSVLNDVPYKFTNRISVPGERSTQEPFIEEHRVRHAQVRKGL